MKILVLTNLFPPHFIGGYELICQTVVDLLRERGHTVPVLTSDHIVTSASGEADSPLVERSLKINGLYGHPWRGLRRLRLLERQNNTILREAIGRHEPDLVYVWNMGGLSKSMLFTLQQLGVPTVFYISDHWIRRGLASDVWLRWWNRTDAPWIHRFVRCGCTATGLRRYWTGSAPADPPSRLSFRRIYFCSRSLRELTAAAGYDVRHGEVIYCPVHQRYFETEVSPPRSALRSLPYVGRLAEDKGVMTALKALSLLGSQFGGHLAVYGQGDSAYVSSLQTFVKERRLPVSFYCAALDKMPRIYRDHDLLLFTSEWEEPFALTPIEAMACGLPVIGTTTGGSAELFRHRENALTYAAGDAQELAERIQEFAADNALRFRCARTAAAEARQRYAAPVIVDQIERYLQETVRTWRPSGRVGQLTRTASDSPVCVS